MNEQLNEQIDMPMVLYEIHEFFAQYPSNLWHKSPPVQSDLPLRTVKTLLFHFCQVRKEKIIDDLDSLNIPYESEIKTYFAKLLNEQFHDSLSFKKTTTGNFNIYKYTYINFKINILFLNTIR